MRTFLFILSASCFIFTHAEAAIFGDDVNLSDLAQLSPEALNSLKDSEFAVFRAKVKHAGAVEAEKKFREQVKSVKTMLDARSLELRAAKTELKEIEQKSAGKKYKEAEEKVAAAQRQYDTVRLHAQWKEKELDIRAAVGEKEKQAVSVAEAERDLARVATLYEQGVLSAKNYNIDDVKKRLEKKKKDYAAAVEKEKTLAAEANRLRSDYENALKKN